MRRSRPSIATSAGLALVLLAALLATLPGRSGAPAASGPLCRNKAGTAVEPTRCLVDDFSHDQYTQLPVPNPSEDLNPGSRSEDWIDRLTVFTVFWLPNGRHFEDDASKDPAYEQMMNQFIGDIGGTRHYNLVTQYDGQFGNFLNSVTWAGSFVDSIPYPHAGTANDKITSDDIAAEANRAAGANGWPDGQNNLVVVFTARGVRISSGTGKEPCGFHGHVDDSGPMGTRTYAEIASVVAPKTSTDDGINCDIPDGMNTSAQDGSVNTLSHEMFETVTDPTGHTWAAGSDEMADKCEYDAVHDSRFAPRNQPNQKGADLYLNGHAYTVQQEWSNAAHTCAMDYCPDLTPDTGVCPPQVSVKVVPHSTAPIEGQTDYVEVDVTNSSDTAAATNVVITGAMPDGFRVMGVNILPSSPTDSFTVNVPVLAVHATESFFVNYSAGAVPAASLCAQAAFSDLLGGHRTSVSATGNQCAQVTPTPDVVVAAQPGWDNMFTDYGDTSGRWNGGDGAQSTPLPNGDTAWFFNDSFFGPVQSSGIRALFSNSQPRNMVAIQHGSSITQSFGGPAQNYLSPQGYDGTLVAGPAQYSDQSHYNLTGGDGMMVGNTLYKFYTVMDATGGNSAFPDAPVDTALATFQWDGSTLHLTSTQVIPIPNTPTISWGIALLNDGGYTYIYGVEDVSGDQMHKYLRIARVPQGQLTNWNGWEFLGDSGWVSSPALSKRVMDYVSDGFSVTDVNGTYVLLTTDTSPGSNPWSAVAYYALTPDGFTTPTAHPIFAPQLPMGHIAYEYRIHPQFSSGKTVLIGYSVNTLNIDPSCMTENYYDASIYRPRFFSAVLPGISGPTGGVTGNGSPPPPTPEYPDPKPVPPSQEVWHVTDPNPSSFSSTTCSFTYPVPPPAPYLTATSNHNKSISLHWTSGTPAMWVFIVDYHDNTADPTWSDPPDSPDCDGAATRGGWCQSPYPLVAQNDFTMNYLNMNHTYSFRVQMGPWRANAGTWSNQVSAEADLPLPTGQATNVQTSTGYGAVTVSWTDPNPNVWFSIIYRDSNGTHETWPTPNHSMTLYDMPEGIYPFTIVETNEAGDGPESEPPVSGTSLACAPVDPSTPCDHP
jgi:hypothetical protein